MYALGKDSSMSELLDVACILITLCEEDIAIAKYLGTAESGGIKRICLVLGSFYELQMLNTGQNGALSSQSTDTSNLLVAQLEHTNNTALDANETIEDERLQKFRRIKNRLILKIFFPKTEELKISRHLHKVYRVVSTSPCNFNHTN